MKHLIDVDGLFLATLDDLAARVNSNVPYEILGIAGLVRKLFLDSHPLVDQANRGRRLKIIFTVLPTKSLDELLNSPTSYFDVVDGLDPATHAFYEGEVMIISRAEFFAYLVAYARGQHITIRDIVTFEANVAGGVHAPNPARDTAHLLLDGLRNQVVIKGHSVSLYHLRNIGKHVLIALRPLYDQITRQKWVGVI